MSIKPAAGHEVIRRLREDRERFIAELDGWQAEFMERMPPTGPGGDHRSARAFAAIYAAGKLAASFKVLPNQVKQLRRILEVYQSYRQANVPPPPFAQRLEDLIEAGEIFTVDRKAEQSAQIEAAEAALGTLTVKRTERVVKLRRDKITLAFPDWLQIQKSEELRALLKQDGRNLDAKGRLAPGMDNERLYQFHLPPNSGPSPFDG